MSRLRRNHHSQKNVPQAFLLPELRSNKKLIILRLIFAIK